MSTPKWLALLIGVGYFSLSQAAGSVIGLGQPLTDDEIASYSITIFPDGRNLPQGRGNVGDGALLYAERCAYCHGAKGIEGPASRLAGSDGFFGWTDPLRVLRINKYPLLIMSMGARWPYATTIFDYVRRAMPHSAPKSLTDEQVYAITGYLLYINGLIDETTIMDRASLPNVKMPGLERTLLAWPPRQ